MGAGFLSPSTEDIWDPVGLHYGGTVLYLSSIPNLYSFGANSTLTSDDNQMLPVAATCPPGGGMPLDEKHWIVGWRGVGGAKKEQN